MKLIWLMLRFFLAQKLAPVTPNSLCGRLCFKFLRYAQHRNRRGNMKEIKRKIVVILFLITTTILIGCEGGLSNIEKSVFFTDRRGFDREIVNEDLHKLSDAIKSNPNNAELFVARGFIYAALHKYTDAISDFELAAKIDSDVDIRCSKHSSIYYLLTLVHRAQGNMTEAYKYYDMQPGPVKSMHDEFVACFYSNKPPLLRPFGYVWHIEENTGDSDILIFMLSHVVLFVVVLVSLLVTSLKKTQKLTIFGLYLLSLIIVLLATSDMPYSKNVHLINTVSILVPGIAWAASYIYFLIKGKKT